MFTYVDRYRNTHAEEGREGRGGDVKVLFSSCNGQMVWSLRVAGCVVHMCGRRKTFLIKRTSGADFAHGENKPRRHWR